MSWIAYHRPPPRARLRLFCLPYAGGTAALYRGWQERLGDDVEVCPVQLPGREGRLSERCFHRVEPLTEALAEALAPRLDLPFAFFGHSLGATVAFETSRRLAARRQPPVALFVSGRRAPAVPAAREPIHTLPEKEFLERIFELSGTPREVLEHLELVELLMPMLRGDFEMNDTYDDSLVDGIALDVPVVAFGGVDDEDVPRPTIEPWAEVTRGAFRLHLVPGDHFSAVREPEALLAVLGRELADIIDSRYPAGC